MIEPDKAYVLSEEGPYHQRFDGKYKKFIKSQKYTADTHNLYPLLHKSWGKLWHNSVLLKSSKGMSRVQH